VCALSDAERAKRGIRMLPGSLHEAIELAKGSRLLRRSLGDHVFESFIENKRIEAARFRQAVTDFELKTYLPLL